MPSLPNMIAIMLRGMLVRVLAGQTVFLPSRAGAANEVKILAGSRHPVQSLRIADLLHDVLQDEEARYAADTASI
jgi:hypothetical protein